MGELKTDKCKRHAVVRAWVGSQCAAAVGAKVSGLSINGERATIQLGADVRLSRGGKGLLEILADKVMMQSLDVSDGIKIDGKNLKDYIRTLIEEVLKEQQK